jgi:hypothetical protein
MSRTGCRAGLASNASSRTAGRPASTRPARGCSSCASCSPWPPGTGSRSRCARRRRAASPWAAAPPTCPRWARCSRPRSATATCRPLSCGRRSTRPPPARHRSKHWRPQAAATSSVALQLARSAGPAGHVLATPLAVYGGRRPRQAATPPAILLRPQGGARQRPRDPPGAVRLGASLRRAGPPHPPVRPPTRARRPDEELLGAAGRLPARPRWGPEGDLLPGGRGRPQGTAVSPVFDSVDGACGIGWSARAVPAGQRSGCAGTAGCRRWSWATARPISTSGPRRCGQTSSRRRDRYRSPRWHGSRRHLAWRAPGEARRPRRRRPEIDRRSPAGSQAGCFQPRPHGRCWPPSRAALRPCHRPRRAAPLP